MPSRTLAVALLVAASAPASAEEHHGGPYSISLRATVKSLTITAAPAGTVIESAEIEIFSASGRRRAERDARGNGTGTLTLTNLGLALGERVEVEADVRDRQIKPRHGECEASARVSDSATASIGTSGGTLSTPAGASLQIPFGALDGNLTLTIQQSGATPPSGIGAAGAVYEFDPLGTLFNRPVTIALPLPAGRSDGIIYCTALDGSGFTPIGGTVQGGVVTVVVSDIGWLGQCVVGARINTRTVTGVGKVTWLSATTRTSVPIDFAGQGVEIITQNGTHLQGVAGTGAALGTFSVANVPNGQYLLHSGQQWLYTSTSSPDLGSVRGGRPDTQRIAPTGDPILRLTAAGLDTWQNGDWLEFYSTEADDWDFQTDRFFIDADGNYPTTYDDVGNIIQSIPPGSTSAPIAIDFLGIATAPSLILGSQGDHALIAQLSQRTSSGGWPYLAMTRLAQIAPFDLPADGALDIGTVTLAPVESDHSIAVDFRGSQFAAALNQDGNPAHRSDCGAPCGGDIGVLAQAGDAEDGFYDANADPLLVKDASLAGADIATGTMSYGVPFDAGNTGNWGLLFLARWSMRTQVTPLPGSRGPGAGLFNGLVDDISWTTTTQAGSAGPITPPITLPVNATVGGQAFFGGGGNIGATPVIAWSRPRSGAADFYTLAVRKLRINQNNRTVGPVVASLITPNTSLTLPAGIIDPAQNNAYIFQLTAMKSTSAFSAGRISSAPFRDSIDLASASISSGNFWSGAQPPPFADVSVIQGGQNFPQGITATGSALYWTERGDAPWDCGNVSSSHTGRIWTSGLDGANPHVIADGQDDPAGIAVAGSNIYWTNASCGTPGAVVSLPVSGGAPTTVATNQGGAGQAILSVNGALYWFGQGLNAILPGQPPQFLGWYGGVNLASDGARLFWTDYGNYPNAPGGQVLSLPISGAGSPVPLVQGQAQTWDVQTDGAYVYWSDQAWQLPDVPPSIQRVPVNGGAPQTVALGQNPFPGSSEIMKVFAIDNEAAYYVDTGVLYAAPLAGGTPRELAPLDQGFCPEGKMVVQNHNLYWTDTCTQSVMHASW